MDYKFIEDIPISSEKGDKLKAHSKIAKALLEVLENGKGTTIALKGKWGSGKSSVIEILKHMTNEKNKNIKFFVFDSWAYEENALSQAFLSEFIDFALSKSENFNPKDEKTKKKRKELQKRKEEILGKVRKVTRNVKPTSKNIFAGLTTIIIIIALIQSLPDFILSSFIWKLISYGSFIALIWLFRKEIAPLGALYQGLFVGKITDDEKETSLSQNPIEFKNFFEEILDSIFKNNNELKVVIVLDNLDRIQGERAISLLTSLKPFMIHDSKPNDSEKEDYTKNVWYIVPFDPEGFSNIFDNKPYYEFLNKMFKLEFSLPMPLYGRWQDVLNSFLIESNLTLANEPNEKLLEAKEALEMAKHYYNYLQTLESKKNVSHSSENIAEQNQDDDNDAEPSKEENDVVQNSPLSLAPTPREIKKFINNLVAIQLQIGDRDEVSFFGKSMFAALKVFNLISDIEDIKKFAQFDKLSRLGKFSFFETKDELFKELCSIYFRDSKKEIEKIMNYDPIYKALSEAEDDLEKYFPQNHENNSISKSLCEEILSELIASDYSVEKHHALMGIKDVEKLAELGINISNEIVKNVVSIIKKDPAKTVEQMLNLKDENYLIKEVKGIKYLHIENKSVADDLVKNIMGKRLHFEVVKAFSNVFDEEALKNLSYKYAEVKEVGNAFHWIGSQSLEKYKIDFVSRGIEDKEVDKVFNEVLNSKPPEAFNLGFIINGIRISEKISEDQINKLWGHINTRTQNYTSINDSKEWERLSHLLLAYFSITVNSPDQENILTQVQTFLGRFLEQYGRTTQWKDMEIDDLILTVGTLYILMDGKTKGNFPHINNGTNSLIAKIAKLKSIGSTKISDYLKKLELDEYFKNRIEFSIKSLEDSYKQIALKLLEDERKDFTWLFRNYEKIFPTTDPDEPDEIIKTMLPKPDLLQKSKVEKISPKLWWRMYCYPDSNDRFRNIVKDKFKETVEKMTDDEFKAVCSNKNFVEFVKLVSECKIELSPKHAGNAYNEIIPKISADNISEFLNVQSEDFQKVFIDNFIKDIKTLALDEKGEEVEHRVEKILSWIKKMNKQDGLYKYVGNKVVEIGYQLRKFKGTKKSSNIDELLKMFDSYDPPQDKTNV